MTSLSLRMPLNLTDFEIWFEDWRTISFVKLNGLSGWLDGSFNRVFRSQLFYFFLLFFMLSVWKQNWFEFEQNLPNNLPWLEMHRISVPIQIGVWMHGCGFYSKLNVRQNISVWIQCCSKCMLLDTLFKSAALDIMSPKIWRIVAIQLQFGLFIWFSCFFLLHSWLCFYYMLQCRL